MKNRPHRINVKSATKVLNGRFPLETARQVIELAHAEFDGNVSNTLVHLVQNSLGGSLSGVSSPADGYNAGLRQGLHEAKDAIREALEKKWR